MCTQFNIIIFAHRKNNITHKTRKGNNTMEILKTEKSMGCTFELTTCDYENEWTVWVKNESGKRIKIAFLARRENNCYDVEIVSIKQDGTTFGNSSELSLDAAFSCAIRAYQVGPIADERAECKELVERLETIVRDLKEAEQKCKELLDEDKTIEKAATMLSTLKENYSDLL